MAFILEELEVAVMRVQHAENEREYIHAACSLSKLLFYHIECQIGLSKLRVYPDSISLENMYRSKKTVLSYFPANGIFEPTTLSQEQLIDAIKLAYSLTQSRLRLHGRKGSAHSAPGGE